MVYVFFGVGKRWMNGGMRNPSHVKKMVNGIVYIGSRSEKASILKEMIASEQRVEEGTEAHATPPVALFINVGLKLQGRQPALKKTKTQDDLAQDIKTRLSTDIKKWHQQQQHICPQVIPFVVAEPDKSPELEKLFMPSDFTGSERAKIGLESLGAEELKIQQGEANDVLRSLHEHIQHSHALRHHKNARNNAVFGQEKNTRAVQKIWDVQTRIQNYVKKYCHAPAAMIALGCNPEDPNFGFPELKDEDLYTKNVNEPDNLGAGKKGYYGNMTPEEEVDYVLDYMERWQEEVEILGQEFRRAIQGFNKMENVWTSLAKDHKNEAGKSAYASKVANMYQQMDSDARQHFTKAGGTWSKEGVSLAQHIKSERPDPKLSRARTG
ncbi:hypothetical protein C8R45DRAFT_922749 [Mycena sanguinolenta]|nr:hypothetical protein C8R45DRAFT_922749 [Mycena sanguinolenta]